MAQATGALKEYALTLGLQALGVVRAGSPESTAVYETWLDAGMHGEMAYLMAHADAKRHPEALLPGVRSIVAVALNYNQPSLREPGKPRIARYALGRDYHKVLRAKLRAVQRFLESAHPGERCRICVDSAPLLEREYAHRAGLGWFGKNTCLIDSRLGSWFVLGFLLTTTEFEPDSPSEGGCGACTECVDACPTGAIVRFNGTWAVDSRRCISYLTIEKRGPLSAHERARLGEWTFGCDVCQEVCPFNQPRTTQPLRAKVTEEPDFLDVRVWPNLVDLVRIREEKWSDLTRGSAVRRAGLEGLRRNASANLELSTAPLLPDAAE